MSCRNADPRHTCAATASVPGLYRVGRSWLDRSGFDRTAIGKFGRRHDPRANARQFLAPAHRLDVGADRGRRWGRDSASIHRDSCTDDRHGGGGPHRLGIPRAGNLTIPRYDRRERTRVRAGTSSLDGGVCPPWEAGPPPGASRSSVRERVRGALTADLAPPASYRLAGRYIFAIDWAFFNIPGA